ncbi:glyoxylate/hydroxypyruvate reductase A [Tistlia consotensis]|uniref:Glyoxylate/hydroxypyruvate reductase A n=1 Tax=Tistlia consotensis USBA 355 TaxID=560819 RepID=A0A1Y6BSC6_9PROT|nr:glyoxylate/hydroxypyruvate reductase A [Tistlia consotensis]SMF25476.1 glyoxylate/hydroxypyruvate reductase A [Tistlia consotensis USBA 355]SNR59306.1 glyoxylate/hydroxypyruvate reductase A [Tistlia consotensis]
MEDAALRDLLAPLLPGVTIRVGPPAGPLPDVVMLVASRLHPGVAPALPNLKLVQKLGAGVDGILKQSELPAGVRVARLRPEVAAEEIAEYCLAQILLRQRNLDRHAADQAAGRWTPLAPRRAGETTVGVLGLGHIGGRTARGLAAQGFRTLGWSRTPRALQGVDCRSGAAALPGLLAECDYLVSVLPSTPETRDLFDAALLARLKPGAVLINVGRGDLIVEADLVAALDSGALGGAVLDVFRQEPLPERHPFWAHLKVAVTPHVSGWHLDGGFEDIAENYRRLLDGRPLLHEVDRAAGY